jgi:hypothetical protein
MFGWKWTSGYHAALFVVRIPVCGKIADNIRTHTWRRFYAEQRAYDQSVGDPLRDDIKRMGRQAKERNQEAQMLDSMYQARVHCIDAAPHGI